MADLTGASYAIIHWHDAHTESEWQKLDDLDQEPYLVRSAGWLIPNGKPNHVVLVQSIGIESVDGVLCIPVGMVVKTTLVTAPEHK